MNRTPVTSSAIKSIGHEGDVVEVEFHSGRVCRHGGCSANDHSAFVGAESIGRHYNTNVKGQFALLPDENSQSEK